MRSTWESKSPAWCWGWSRAGWGALLRGSAEPVSGSAACAPSPPQVTELPSSAPPPCLGLTHLLCLPIWLSPSSPSLCTSIFPSPLHTCTRLPHRRRPLGCGINTVVTDPLPPACGGRGHTAHAQPAQRRDAVMAPVTRRQLILESQWGLASPAASRRHTPLPLWRLQGPMLPMLEPSSPQDSPTLAQPWSHRTAGVVPSPAGGARAPSWRQRNFMQGVGRGLLQGVLGSRERAFSPLLPSLPPRFASFG